MTDRHTSVEAAIVRGQSSFTVCRMTVGICSIIANIETCGGYPVTSIFDTENLWPDYISIASHECPLCKKGEKLDAMVNTYGFSSF